MSKKLKNGMPQNSDSGLGRQIRLARNSIGASLKTLSGRLGISLQQLQRYESGGSSVTVGMLLRISAVTGKPIEFFVNPPEYFHARNGTQSEELETLITEFSKIRGKKKRDLLIRVLREFSRGG